MLPVHDAHGAMGKIEIDQIKRAGPRTSLRRDRGTCHGSNAARHADYRLMSCVQWGCMIPQEPDPNAAFRLRVLRGGVRPCPYGFDRLAQEIYAIGPEIDSHIYQALMDNGFRRGGSLFYKPTCPGCRQCIPIRVPAIEFAPSRSQRRSLARNADVQVTLGPIMADDERFDLFWRYQSARHPRGDDDSFDNFRESLGTSPIDSIEMAYRVGDRLIGIGIVDVTPLALSSVYFYFDPLESRRRLGVFSALREIEECRVRGLPFWYPGFYVPGNPKMAYKSDFRPHQVLVDGRWGSSTCDDATTLDAKYRREPDPDEVDWRDLFEI